MNVRISGRVILDRPQHLEALWAFRAPLVVLEPLGKGAQALDRVTIWFAANATHCRLDIAKGLSDQAAASAGVEVPRHAPGTVLAELTIKVGLQERSDAHALRAVAHPLQERGQRDPFEIVRCEVALNPP